MEWDVLFDEDLAAWFDDLVEGLQDEILANIEVMRQLGPNLGRPPIATAKGSADPNMKEVTSQ